MATTGFWPVRGKLKDIIDYAENPDKTTAKEYLDNDLYDALRYVENDDKTDRKMYVTALNCSKSTAYEQMTAVKRKYGERRKIIPATDRNTFINSFCGVWGAFLKSVPRKTHKPVSAIAGAGFSYV